MHFLMVLPLIILCVCVCVWLQLQVINVRNCVMHSPDFTVSRQDFEQHLDKIKTFASLMDQHAQDLKTLPNEIEKVNSSSSLGEPR